MGMANQVLSLVEQGKIVLRSGKTFALQKAEQAVRYTQTGGQEGKALLVG